MRREPTMKLVIPESLQRFTDDKDCYQLNINQLDQLHSELEKTNPQLAKILFRDKQQLDYCIRLALNNELLNSLSPDNPVKENDEVSILIAVSGG